jgi:hypothetical protein
MKNKNLLLSSLLLITIIVVTIISCKKPENLVNPESISNNREGGGGGRVCCNGITTICSGTIMYFPTLTDFDNTVNCLEDAYEAWNTAFDNTYDSTIYTIDQWDDYADSIGFNEDEPLIEFEECTRFSSLRMYLDSLENEWEETHNLDSIHDPDLVTVIDDDIEQCLYNRFNEIAIGDTIYKFYKDGTVIAIGGLDCNAIEEVRKDSTFRNSRIAAYNPPPPTPTGLGLSASCTIWSDRMKQSFPYHKNSIEWVPKNIGYSNTEKTTNLKKYIQNNKKIFLKMDIEGSEFNWLDSMTETELENFSQIVLEVHWPFDIYRMNMLQKLNKTHYIIHIHGNNYCDRDIPKHLPSGRTYDGTVTINNNMIPQIKLPEVFEITYVNKNIYNKCTDSLYVERVKPKEIKFPTILDYPNNPNADDIYFSIPVIL